MRKVRQSLTNPDAAAAAIEVAALGKWPNIKKGDIRSRLKKTALARVFMEFNVGSQSNANLEALFNDGSSIHERIVVSRMDSVPWTNPTTSTLSAVLPAGSGVASAGSVDL